MSADLASDGKEGYLVAGDVLLEVAESSAAGINIVTFLVKWL